MERVEHLATAPDGTRVWWSELGAGSPAVVLTDGIGCAGYIWRRLAPRLARRTRVIHWNYRGHGRSGVPADPERVTLRDCVGDLLAVLDAAGEPGAVLAGHSMGVQVALEAHRAAPERVRALLLVCGSPGHPIDTFHDSPVLRLAFPWARAAVERHPDVARALFRTLLPTDLALELALRFEVNRALVSTADLLPYFHDLAQVDPPLFMRMLTSAADHDASDHLPHVTVPTLVVAGEHDGFTPTRLSVAMHEAIRGSELLIVPGGTHVAPLERPDLVGERVEAFLDGLPPAPPRRPRAKPRPAAARGPRRKGGRAPREG